MERIRHSFCATCGISKQSNGSFTPRYGRKRSRDPSTAKRIKKSGLPLFHHDVDVFEKRLEILFVLDFHLEYAEYNIVSDRILVFDLF